MKTKYEIIEKQLAQQGYEGKDLDRLATKITAEVEHLWAFRDNSSKPSTDALGASNPPVGK